MKIETVRREQAEEKIKEILSAMAERQRKIVQDAHGDEVILGPDRRAVWLEPVQNEDGDWLVGASFDTLTETHEALRRGEDELPDRVFSEATTTEEMIRVINEYLG